MRSLPFALFIMALLVAAPTMAQEPVLATTETGQAVLLYPDGTWKYKTEAPAARSGSKRYSKLPSATDRQSFIQGKVIVNFDPRKWKRDKEPQEAGIGAFVHTAGDGYAKVISERVQIPLETLKRIALQNAREAAPDVRIVSEEKRVVNGKEVLFLQMKGTLQGIRFVYLGYYYSGKEGSIQVLTYTGENLLEEYRKDFEEFLNGFEVAKP